MKKSTKIILGIATVWPILFYLFFMMMIFFFPSEVLSTTSEPPIWLSVLGMLTSSEFAILTMILIWALEITYIVDVFKNDKVQQDKKVLWAVVLFLGNVVAMPIYWYLYIWREPELQ